MDYSSLSCDELVRACAEGNAEAWREFVRRFTSVISAAIWRVGRRCGEKDSTIIPELVQETYLKLWKDNCRLLRKFRSYHENALYGWLSVVASRVALDHYRKPRPPVDPDPPEPLPDPHPDSDRLEFRRLCEQVDAILRAHCSARDREIFWLYYGEMGLTAAEIAKIKRFDLDESGVESVLTRLKRLLRGKLGEAA